MRDREERLEVGSGCQEDWACLCQVGTASQRPWDQRGHFRDPTPLPLRAFPPPPSHHQVTLSQTL